MNSNSTAAPPGTQLAPAKKLPAGFWQKALVAYKKSARALAQTVQMPSQQSTGPQQSAAS